jgi:hypothetical protein
MSEELPDKKYNMTHLQQNGKIPEIRLELT